MNSEDYSIRPGLTFWLDEDKLHWASQKRLTPGNIIFIQTYTQEIIARLKQPLLNFSLKDCEMGGAVLN